MSHRREDHRLCLSVLAWMEARFSDGPEDVRDLIAVSGVDMIPDPGQPGSELRALLGPARWLSGGHFRALTSANAISGDFFPVDVDPGWASSSVG